MNNHGFASAIGLREISIDPGDGFGPMYVSSKSSRKHSSELIDLLEKVLFHLMGCLTWVDRSFNLWYEKFYGKNIYRDVILVFDQYLIADSFSHQALIADTRRVSSLVQRMKIFKDNKN